MTSQYEIDLCKMAEDLSPFVVGTEGNVSRRLGNGFIIKSSGKSFKELTLDGLADCDEDGHQLGINKPSIESVLHAYIYKMNPRAKFIAHTHPVNCLKIVCNADKMYTFANDRFFPDQVVFNGRKSCIVPYAMPGEPLAEALDKAVSGWLNLLQHPFPEMILLANHGIICCGKTAKECVIKTQICEKAAASFSMDNSPLSYEQVREILEDPKEIHRRNLV
jgi:L-fuculose-phosphate aldolase